MGCCCSCDSRSEDIYEDTLVNDKTNLLANPVSENGLQRTVEDRGGYPLPRQKHESHQAKMNRILQITANSYIDVPALNSPLGHPSSSQTYDTVVNQVLQKHKNSLSCAFLLAHILPPEKALSCSLLPADDRNMVNEFSTWVFEAMEEVKIDFTDDLIIPFNGPPMYTGANL